MLKIEYFDEGEFAITFLSGKVSDRNEIPEDGVALVAQDNGAPVVVTLENYDGPLKPNKVYSLTEQPTTITGEFVEPDYEEEEEGDDDDVIDVDDVDDDE